jgi:xylan 1,4-beta-xylosidase
MFRSLLCKFSILAIGYFATSSFSLAAQSQQATDPQTMLSTQGGDVAALIWDFEQPIQNVSNRSFYTRPIPAHAASPVDLRIEDLAPNAAYSVQVYRVGYHANDAYSAYLEWGSPKDLSAAQTEHLSNLTRDLPETKMMRSGPAGGVEFTVPMNSNDVVLVKVKRDRGDK